MPVTADEGAFGRNDRRTIIAGRWEHDIDANTTWRTQVGVDERNFDQPFYTSSSRGSYPSYTVLSDITHRTELFGLPTVGYAALSYSAIDTHIALYNRAPYGGPRLGALTSNQEAVQSNLGGRARAEIALSEQWTGIAGLSAENTWLKGRTLTYAYSAAGTKTALADIDRSFLNVAPELALVYPARFVSRRPRPRRHRLRHAGRERAVHHPGRRAGQQHGFAHPDQSRLRSRRRLVAPARPAPEPHRLLRVLPQRARHPVAGGGPAQLHLQRPGFRASRHRGGAEWAFSPGWRAFAAYGLNDQFYTRYVEQLSAAA